MGSWLPNAVLKGRPAQTGQECLTLCPYWMGVGMVPCQTMHTMGALHCLGLAPPSDPTDQCKKKGGKRKGSTQDAKKATVDVQPDSPVYLGAFMES